jgi:hypothetical protein
MKKILKLSLAAIAIAALAACGGGNGDGDDTGVYVGTWKSKCNQYTATNGAIYSQTFNLTFAKSGGSVLVGTYSNSQAFTDTACQVSIGTKNNYTPIKISIGAKANFLGGSVDAMVLTFDTGEARPGYMNADSKNMNIVVVNDDGSQPRGWGGNSPYTKQ